MSEGLTTRAPDADRLSWKTTHHFRRMLRTRASAAYADALKKPRYDRSGTSMRLRLPETPWEEKHHEGEESSASRSDIGAHGCDICIERIGMGEPAGEP